MKRKPTVIGLIVVLCAGAGLFACLKFYHPAAAPDKQEEAAPPPVVSVQLGKIERMTLHDYLTGYGTVAPAPASATEPAADAPLAAPVAGVVGQVNVAEGQPVAKGDVVMTLNSGGMTLEYAQQEVARQKKLYAEHNTARRDLENAQAQLALLRVISPLSGTIARLNVTPGAAVDLNTVVAEVIDLKRLAVRTDIPAPEAGALRPGQEVQVLTEPPVKTTLAFVSATVDTNNGTIQARAPLPAESGLHPGQFVRLRVMTGTHRDCLAAPAESVVTDTQGRSVIALVQGDEATQMPVQTGFRENGWVEITAPGLKPGEAVVTVGAYGLPEKTKIRLEKSSDGQTSTNASSAR